MQIKPWWLTLPITLMACGTVPVGSAEVPDVQVVIPATLELPSTVTAPVVYLRENKFGGQGIPALVNSVGISGTARYDGTGQVQQVKVFVRPSLDNLAACLNFTEYVVCFGDESAQLTGTIDFRAGNPTGVALGGPALLNAAKAGQGYFGLQATGSSVVAGDALRLTGLRAVARF